MVDKTFGGTMQLFEHAQLSSSRILIVDDRQSAVRSLEALLDSAGFRNHRRTLDLRLALPLFTTFRPDIVLLNVEIRRMDGFSVLANLVAALPPRTFVPILVLANRLSPALKQKAIGVGAADFLTTPFDAVEVVQRIGNLLQLRRLHATRTTDGRESIHFIEAAAMQPSADHISAGRPVATA